MKTNQGSITDRTVSYKQAGAVLMVSLLSPIIRIFPKSSAVFAGKGAWLSPVAAAPFLFLLAFIYNSFLKKGEPDTLSDMIIKGLGKIAGRAVLGIIGVWLIYYIGIVTRTSSERIISTIFPSGAQGAFSVTILAAAVIMALGKLKSMGRMSEIFLLLIGGVLVVTIVAGIKDCRVENLLPVTVYDTGNILIGAFPVINVVSTGAYMLFLDCNIKGKKAVGTGDWQLYL